MHLPLKQQLKGQPTSRLTFLLKQRSLALFPHPIFSWESMLETQGEQELFLSVVLLRWGRNGSFLLVNVLSPFVWDSDNSLKWNNWMSRSRRKRGWTENRSYMVKVEFRSTDHVENRRNTISLPDQSHENWWTQSSYKRVSLQVLTIWKKKPVKTMRPVSWLHNSSYPFLHKQHAAYPISSVSLRYQEHREGTLQTWSQESNGRSLPLPIYLLHTSFPMLYQATKCFCFLW